jgi:tetratricopeptide (TPR) repeat protein
VNTTPNSESNPDKPSPDPPAKPASKGPVASASSGKRDKPAADQKKHDDLPEREPLTPEEVEDEAIRGDFMLRWALVLLALLIGCTAIAETQTLVHVKSGQYTLENFLPARTGIYSATAEDRPWHNLSWLFDVLLAGVYALGGGIGLSIFKALLAAAIFWNIVHTNRKDVSTWWGTICAGLALIVAHRQLTARPEIITLLGLAVTLRLLHRWREERQTKYLKGLAIVFLLWSNMDPGMFYGLAVLVFYAVGETSGNWLGYAGLDNDTHRKHLWMAVGCCVAVTLLNPFGWNALLAPVARYATEYPALQEYYDLTGRITYEQLQHFPVWQPEFWTSLDPAAIAGLVLAAAALISFVLNFRRLDFGDFITWLGFVAFACLATHEFAAAAVVSAVLATLNAQQWYQHTFRQTYSVETSELVFSRGGRAVTVLALAGLAYLSISGLWGRLQTRTGLGLDPNLQGAIESFETELTDSYDDRPFNFVLWQGDVLVWIGKKPFIDSRLPLYAGTGEDDLIAIHQKCRQDLTRSARPGSGGRQWKPTLDRFRITHVVPRMDSRVDGRPVSYGLFFSLLQSADWQLSGLGASTAVFYRTDLTEGKLRSYLDSHRTDFVKQAFRTATQDPEVRIDWARGRSFTERWLSRPADVTPNSLERAKNYLSLLEFAATGRFPRMESSASDPRSLTAAFAHLVIRECNAGLERRPQNADAFRLLGNAYFMLYELVEKPGVFQSSTAAVVQPDGRRGVTFAAVLSAEALRQRRYRQAAAALQQAVTIAPDDEAAWQLLANIQFSNRKDDLAIESYERCLEFLDRQSDSGEQAQRLRELFTGRIREAKARVNPIHEKVEKVVEGLGEDDAGRFNRFRIASGAAQSGCVKLAIELIEADFEMTSREPQAAYFYVDLLQQAGRAREAAEQLDQLESRLEDRPRSSTWRTFEAISALTRADYAKAERTWTFIVEEFQGQQFQQIMGTLPLTMRPPSAVDPQRPPGPWVTDQTAALSSALSETPFQIAIGKMQVALTQMETGHPQRAAETIREMVKSAPNAPMRELGGFYLRLLTGEELPPLSPAKTSPAKTSPAKTSLPKKSPPKKSARPSASPKRQPK